MAKKMIVVIAGILAIFCFFESRTFGKIAQNDGETCFHKIKKGETLWKLFGKNWKIVAAINKISPDRLKPKAFLIIPCQWEKLDDYFPLPKDFPKEDFPKENPNAKSRFVLIDLQQQAFGAYENGKLAFWGPISSGRRKFETPEGNFKILQKDKKRISKSYPKPNGGTPMPYALKFYGDYWIHAGPLPGKPDSHGCVRLMEEDARKLFQWVAVKTPVKII